ncbi:proteoglycan 4-like isoform X1 [Gadus morhua]|uniref:proteoglycan 4-like isoform X1 n=1 Tax=Gadus morhua TaxID=8049 RepID=UPI0011B5FF91|nr:proteoglycan 4-like isoform X1 [Gadus morhua]
MQTRNILTAALLVCLSSTICSAPVEETEVEEQEAIEEVEEEEELSEEEDDDDSKSLDSIMGTGAHAGSSPSRGPGHSAFPGAGAQRPSDHVVFPSGSSLLLEASDNNNARSQVQEGQNVSSLGSAASVMVSDLGPPASETSPLASTLPTSSPTNPRSPAPGDPTLPVYLTFNQSDHPSFAPDPSSSSPDQSPSTPDHPSSTLGQSPPTLGQSPSTLGQSPPTLGQSPSTLGQSPSTLGQSPSTLGQSPSTLAPGSAAVNTASDHAPSVGQQESQSTTVPAREQPGNGRQTLLADTGRGSSVAMATVVDGNRGQVETGTAAYQMDVETVMVEVSSPPPGTATSFSDVTGGTESPAVEHLSHTLSASLLPTDTGTMATAMTTHTDQQTATQQMQTAASAAQRLHPPGPGTQGAEDVELEDSC